MSTSPFAAALAAAHRTLHLMRELARQNRELAERSQAAIDESRILLRNSGRVRAEPPRRPE